MTPRRTLVPNAAMPRGATAEFCALRPGTSYGPLALRGPRARLLTFISIHSRPAPARRGTPRARTAGPVQAAHQPSTQNRGQPGTPAHSGPPACTARHGPSTGPRGAPHMRALSSTIPLPRLAPSPRPPPSPCPTYAHLLTLDQRGQLHAPLRHMHPIHVGCSPYMHVYSVYSWPPATCIRLR